MIEPADVIEFLDRCAPTWDAEMVRHDMVIEKILDNGGIRAGITVLDVACGTGVLFGDYLSRGVKSVIGVDISPEMAKRAAQKFPVPQIQVICGDIEKIMFDNPFDAVMVYNAFPHFPEPDRLIQKLALFTRAGGRLTVAHGMSRSKIDSRHHGPARKVSNGLMSEIQLQKIFEPYFEVDIVISDDEMYQVSGVRKV